MRLPLEWLAEYVDVTEPIEALARRLTAAGPKVEAVHRPPEGVLEQVRVARIVEAAPHPGSDHLWVCHVEAGDGRHQVVSGAPNTRPGIRVPYAPPGTRLPEGDGRTRGTGEAGGTRTVGVRQVRGVASEGMLCSQAELGVGPDASGLWVLPGEPPEGATLAEALPLAGQVLEFEIYPNRPDCLSVLGLAREWHAVSGLPLRQIPVRLEEGPTPVEERVEVTVEAPDLCPRYAARAVEGVRIAPSPPWMQERLLQAGMRPINNVVDVTNYVMLELGQPLHAFDADRVRAEAGDKAALVIRRAREGERIVTLDGVERQLTPEMLLIAGRRQPLVVAGIMGGEEAEVDAGTTEVVLESASFHGPSIRRTSRLLGIRSESSLRFEKGLDPDLVPLALDRAAALLAELAGGRVAQGRIDLYAKPRARVWVPLSTQRANRLLGTRLEAAEMVAHLQALDFEVREVPGGLEARAPVGRVDVEREADLVEEVGRLHGYGRIEPTIPASAQVGGPGRTYHGRDRIRDVLAGAGLSEAITYSFIDPEELRRLEVPERDWLRLENPLSREQSVMRASLLPGLIGAARVNLNRLQYGEEVGVALFELGRVFGPGRPEEERLGLLLTGRHPVRSWRARRDASFFDLKGLLEVVGELFSTPVLLEPDAGYPYHPGQSARWVLDGTVVGWLGALHPRAQQRFDLAGRWPRPVYVAEVKTEPLVGRARPPLARTPSTFPGVTRDLALAVPRDLPAARVTETVQEAAGPLLEGCELFDRYEGEQVEGGRVSLGYRLTFRTGRTLTDAEVNGRIQAILDALEGLDVRVR